MSRIAFRTFAIGVSILGVGAFGPTNIAFAAIGVPGMPLPGNPDFTITFDENGNGFINNQLVPWGPVDGGGIVYVLPVPVNPGSVIVNASSDVGPNSPNGFSDLLTFFNVSPGGVLSGVLFYQSLLDDASPPDLADVLNLVQPTTTFSVAEIGPEGANGFTWVDPFGLSATVYNGISDIPEPSTFILGTLGLMILSLLGWRHHRGAGGLAKSC